MTGPTLEDVARLAGVSRATVSRVVNGTRNVDPEIQRVVREAVARCGYTVNRAARSLATGEREERGGRVALVLAGAGEERSVFTDPFFGRVLDGAIGALGPRGVHPQLLLAEGEDGRARALAALTGGRAEGALVVSTDPVDPLPRRLWEAGLQVVVFARPVDELPVSWVDLAHHQGGALAAERLLAGGRRRLAVVSGPADVPAARERLEGFRQATARAGVAFVPAYDGGFTLTGGEAAAAALLREHPEVDGVFAANDLMAQGAQHVLRELGRDVPGEVALVGFDDSSAALACRPLLTTVRQPVESMAARMAELLLDRLASPQLPPRSILFEPELVLRQSA